MRSIVGEREVEQMRRRLSPAEVVAARRGEEGQSQRARVVTSERPDWGKATSLDNKTEGSCCWCSGAFYKRQDPARDGFDSPTFRLFSSAPQGLRQQPLGIQSQPRP